QREELLQATARRGARAPVAPVRPARLRPRRARSGRPARGARVGRRRDDPPAELLRPHPRQPPRVLARGPRHAVVDAAGNLARALQTAKRMYLTTVSTSGRSGTVPPWCRRMDGALHFPTLRASLKARRIKATGRVRVGLGAPDGPSFEGRAEWVDDRPDLEQAVLAAYRRKSPLVVPPFMGRWLRKPARSKT